MDSRKVIKFGNSSFVVTLPNDWVKKNSLSKESQVNISENNNSLIVSVDNVNMEKVAQIDANSKPLKLLNREIISYYLKNYLTIKVNGKNIIEKLEEIKVIKEKLSSVEIVEIHKDSIVLKDLTSYRKLNVLDLIHEIIEMEKILFDELVNDKTDNKHYFISSLDSNVNKLNFLGKKAINHNLDNFVAPQEIRDTIHYWRIIESLEHMGDKIKRLARYLKDIKEPQKKEKINQTILNIKEFFTFVTSLLNADVNLDNNLKLHLDKKQSLMMEFEELRDILKDELTLYLVITQLFKDLVGEMDNVILSVIDLRNK